MGHSQDKNNTPSIFVIFGVTGDLAAKKIMPSLWHLFQHGRLPDQLRVIGFSRRELGDKDYKDLIREAVKKHVDSGTNEAALDEFFSLFSYQKGTFEDERAFRELSGQIDELEKNWGVCANKLFYLAVPPSSYEPIFRNLAETKLNLPCGGQEGWSRILIEKPFGTDLASAKQLQSLLSSYFKEDQIYRIDHYLFKEIIQGIENFRFSNNLFENAWDNTMIERIDVRLLESIGVEDRGGFYDSVGALRDVGQNHILAMLAAITMDYPGSMDIESIRKARTASLKSLRGWEDDLLKKKTFRAQYRGYRDIKGVNPNSDIETYFALETELSNPKWKGVPIYMEAGKRMAESRKEIILTLKHPKVCLLCEQGPHSPNKIVFRLEPNDEVVIHFWTKRPGFEKIIEERLFSFFLYEKETKIQYVEEYAKIIHAAMVGDQTLFVSADEVLASWQFADPIILGWKRNIIPLLEYDPGTTPENFIKEVEETGATGGNYKGDIGIIGLGKMGCNIARRLATKKWKVVGYNRDNEVTKKLQPEGIVVSNSIRELVEKIEKPRIIWLMVPHDAVDSVIEELAPLMDKGDILIDGGNSFYKESMRRNNELSAKGIEFLDVGVSGGPDGALNGACIMVGGPEEIYGKCEHLFIDLSLPRGYAYMGKSGAGHFVKMVHNGIEYGMMQAIGEGFEIMKNSPFSLNLHSVADLYNHGSVISSSLMNWLKEAYEKFGDKLDTGECCSGEVGHSGEGQWTVDTAHELGVPAPIIGGSLEFRKKSKGNPSYTGKVLSALRHQFGGHDTSKK